MIYFTHQNMFANIFKMRNFIVVMNISDIVELYNTHHWITTFTQQNPNPYQCNQFVIMNEAKEKSNDKIPIVTYPKNKIV